jgi:hypothetical protein
MALTRNQKIALFFGILFVVIVLTSIILTIVLVRDSGTSQDISHETWALPKEMRKSAIFLDESEKLKSIWSDQSVLTPENLIRGGQATYDEIHNNFAKLGMTDTQKGIVLCAGGYNYFTSVFLLIRQLRQVGCTLPIELWHKNREIQASQVQYMKRYGVICLNIEHYLPFVITHTFSLKICSMLLSSFTEILYLDADNNVLYDPTFLFDTPEYKAHEALFWPDFWSLNIAAPCYLNFPGNITQSPKFQQDSGQLVLNKSRYNAQLWYIFRILENHLENLFPVPFNFGDKDLFHATWLATNQSFTFIPHRTGAILDEKHHGVGMAQFAPDGSLLFIHQNRSKWCERIPNQRIWRYMQKHTDPIEGALAEGSWTLTGPHETTTLNLEVEENQSLEFLKELRKLNWYQVYYGENLKDITQN